MSDPRVCIVILNWNGWPDTIECLESVQGLNYPEYCTVVVDNGSQDGSLLQIQSWARGEIPVKSEHVAFRQDNKPVLTVLCDRTTFEDGGSGSAEQELTRPPAPGGIVLVQAGENLGYARGCNVGIRYALAAGAAYVWLLNNDTVVEPGSLTSLVRFLEAHPGYQGVTGQIRLYHDPSTVWNCGGSLTWYGGRRYDYAETPAVKTPQQGFKAISFITGCCALFRTALFKEVGLLCEDFFVGEEDFELSKRLQRLGYLLACQYDATVYHKVGVSISRAARGRLSGRIYIHYLNRFIDMRRYWPEATWRLWRLLYSLYILLMLRLRYGWRFRESWHLLRLLLHDSLVLDRVEKSTFDWAMSLDLEKDLA